MESLSDRELGNGRYRIGRRLGGGGMGVVYSAIDQRIGVPVAIKFLAPDLNDKTELRARLKQEGYIQARLQHSSICRVFDIFEEDDLLGLVLELLEGDTLADRVRVNGPVELETLWHWMMPVFDAVHHAHAHRIIHRDLKPNNVMLVQDGTREIPKVLDFGVAKIIDDTRTALTGAGRPTPGTPQFMAPEQVRGEPVDARTDVYALGAILFYMATGQLPFSGPGPEVWRQKREGERPRHRPSDLVAGLPTRFDECVTVALAPEPSDRFRSVSALANAFGRAVRDGLPDGVVLDTGPFPQHRESSTSLPVTVVERGTRSEGLLATEHGAGALEERTAEIRLGTTEHTADSGSSPAAEGRPGAWSDDAPSDPGPSSPQRAGSARYRLWLFAGLLVLLGGAYSVSGLELWLPSCSNDRGCDAGAVCQDGRCRAIGMSGVDFYEAALDAYNRRDRAAYLDAWASTIDCFWRKERSWTLGEIAEMRATQFDEGGRRFELIGLDSELLGANRLRLTEQSVHHKPSGVADVRRQVILERRAGRWRIVAEAAPGADCLSK